MPASRFSGSFYSPIELFPLQDCVQAISSSEYRHTAVARRPSWTKCCSARSSRRLCRAAWSRSSFRRLSRFCHAAAIAGVVTSSGSSKRATVSSVMYLLERGPLVVLFEEVGADQADDGVIIGEDTDDVGPALDLLVDPLRGAGNRYEDVGAAVSGLILRSLAYGTTIRDRGTGSTKVRAGRSTR